MGSAAVHIGVDIGGSKVMGVALGPPGSPVATGDPIVEPTPTTPDDLVRTVRSTVERVAMAAGAPPAAVGLGVAGYIDLGGIARHAPNLRPAEGRDLAAAVRSDFGVAVYVDNDVNCAARAAMVLDAPDVSSLAMITLGTGIGGALVVDGEIVRGSRGFAGEFGHMIVEPDGPLCVCGQRGCWERRASGAGLAGLAREAVAGGRGSTLLDAVGSPDDVSGPLVMSLAASGKPEAVAVLETFAEWVAVGILNVVNMVDPEVVILGGGMTAEGDRLIGPVRRHFETLASVGPPQPPDIVVSSLGPAAGAVGAAILAGGVPGDR